MSVVEEYIKANPEEAQGALKKLRQAIRKAAPGAEERISYGVPCFAQEGNLVYFGAWKTHIGFYPGSSRAHEAFRKEFAPFSPSKGTLRFPLDRPMPLDLVAKVVRFRVQENLEKAAKKSPSKPKPKQKQNQKQKSMRKAGSKTISKPEKAASGKFSKKVSQKASKKVSKKA